MVSPTFSFIVPTRRRPRHLRRLLDSIVSTSADSSTIEVVLVVNNDDDESRNFTASDVKITHVIVAPDLRMGALNGAGYEAASGRYVMCLGDDVVIRTQGWDRQVLGVLRSFPDEIVLVHVNELIFRDTLCTFPLVTREYCRQAGGICPTEYTRYRIDDHIHNVFDLLSVLGINRRIFLPDVVFEHMHPDSPVDSRGIRHYVPISEIQAIDTELFDALLPARKRLALSLYETIRQRRGLSSTFSWQSLLDNIEDSVAIRRPEHARWFRRDIGISGSVSILLFTTDVNSARTRKCLEFIKLYTPQVRVRVQEHAPNAASRSRERNRLLDECETDYLVFLNDDVTVESGWLETLVTATTFDAALAVSCEADGITPGLMLIDLAKCGDIRFNEALPESEAVADYGARVLDAGWRIERVAETKVIRPARISEQPASVPHIGAIERDRHVLTQHVHRYADVARYAADVLKSQRSLIRLTGDRLLPKIRKPGPLFDSAYYLLRNPDVAAAGLDPFTHYRNYGRKEGRKPNPLFDPGFYLRSYSDVAQAKVDPLTHFLEHGAANQSNPHPLFDTAFYLKQNPDVAARGFNPLVHYLESGGLEGRSPHQLFDGVFYLKSYPAVADAGLNPLAHFVERGFRSGFWPNPLFDPGYYLGQNPDVAQAGVNPLVHFVEAGAVVGRRPHPMFDVNYYVDRNPDARSGNPLAHYLSVGGRRRYSPSSLFDVGYYLRNYSQGNDIGDPLLHFLERGAFEGCNPNPHFDVRYYLSRNPDVAAAGVNPLVHFLLHGASEGRNPNPLFDVKAYAARYPDVQAARCNPLEHFLLHGMAESRIPSITGTYQNYLDRVESSPRTPESYGPASIYVERNLVPISVVIPTHNRGPLLANLIEACHRNAGGCELEYVIVDDGSTDDTVDWLTRLAEKTPNLTWRSIPKSGPGRARNVGVDAARYDVILFLGDDIHPINSDFFRVHATLHGACSAVDYVVLGKVIWASDLKMTYTMAHVQGRGTEQFDYANLKPYTITGWRHFYTANLSVKKAIVPDWILHGFCTDFPGAAMEDIELGYRLAKSPVGLRIYYDPGSVGEHHHHYTIAQFMERQFFAGKSVKHMMAKHPDVDLGPFGRCRDAAEVEIPETPLLPDHYPAIAEGIKAFARTLEDTGTLGLESWHDDFLTALFELCALEGFSSTFAVPAQNQTAARAVILECFLERMRPILDHEIADWEVLARNFVPSMTLDIIRTLARPAGMTVVA